MVRIPKFFVYFLVSEISFRNVHAPEQGIIRNKVLWHPNFSSCRCNQALTTVFFTTKITFRMGNFEALEISLFSSSCFIMWTLFLPPSSFSGSKQSQRKNGHFICFCNIQHKQYLLNKSLSAFPQQRVVYSCSNTLISWVATVTNASASRE